MMSRVFLGLALGGLLASPAEAAISLPISVQEPAGTSRTAEPVTSGVPLPAGTQTTRWALFDGNKEIPVQVTPLGGRVPWILLDFQVDVGSGQTKVLTLKEQEPQVTLPALAPSAPATKRSVTLAGSSAPIEGVPDTETWEYRGPLRAVLRVDGHYGNVKGFGFSTRYTFYAHKKYVRVEHILRNSVQAERRHLKLTSATVVLGTGETRAQAQHLGSVSVGGGTGVTFQLIPEQQAGMRDRKKRQAVNVAENGGFILPDLTHYGATVIYDPDKESHAALSPLFALADSAWYAEHGELSTRHFGSLEDERETYRRLGWKWSAKQEPHYPHQPDYTVNMTRVAIHYDSESDDLWSNVIMYLRSGIRGFLDRSRAWANYYKWEMVFRTDGFKYAWDGNGERPAVARPDAPIELTPYDLSYLKEAADGKTDTHTWAGDHLWGWGLLDYYDLTGDMDALQAAIDLGGNVEQLWMWRKEYHPLYGTRAVARNLLFAVRLYDATDDPRWKKLADHLIEMMLATGYWKENWGTYAYPRQAGGWYMSPHHNAELHTAFARYDERIGNPEVKRRLIRMSEFARDHALHPKWQHSAKSLSLDVPQPGAIQYQDWNDDAEPIMNPYHTFVFVDTLVRGYRLTGDKTFLNRARYFWDRGSKAQFKKPANYRVVGDGAVGHFANAHFNCCGTHPIFFKMNGELQFVSLLFWDAARVDLPPLGKPAALRAPAAPLPTSSAIVPVSFEAGSSPPRVVAQASPVEPAQLRGLGSNQWRQLDSPPRTVYQPILSNQKETSDCGRTITDGNPIFRSFSGLAAGDGVVLSFGGGHAGHPGNDLDLYSFESNTWTIPYAPECPEPGTPTHRQVRGGGVATRGISPQGRPWVHHTYQNTTYDPVRKRFIFVGGEGTWSFDVAQRAWKLLVQRDREGGPTWGSTGAMVYDPAHERMVAIVSNSANNARRGVYYFDLKHDRWAYAAAFPSVDGYSFATKYVSAASVPRLREAIVLLAPVVPGGGVPKLWRLNLDTNGWKEVTSFGTADDPAAPAGSIPTGGANWDYDSRNNRVVFLATPREASADRPARPAHTWTWDPEKDVWEQLPAADIRPGVPGRARYSFVYEPRYNAFLYVEVKSLYCGVMGVSCGGPTTIWLYRLAGDTPPATPAPRARLTTEIALRDAPAARAR
jgi:hypothetical protein